jgi:hypothetical protein
MAAWSIRGLGIANRPGADRGLSFVDVGLALGHRLAECPLAGVMGFYLLFPLLLFAGPIWLFGWVAAFVAPMSSTNKKDRETDL